MEEVKRKKKIMLGTKKVFTLGDGREIEIETGKLAKQADGSAVVRMGDTMILATVCAKKEAGENVDFMPLTVDYQEKYAAMGRFPGGFFKREARPSEYKIKYRFIVSHRQYIIGRVQSIGIGRTQAGAYRTPGGGHGAGAVCANTGGFGFAV